MYWHDETQRPKPSDAASDDALPPPKFVIRKAFKQRQASSIASVLKPKQPNALLALASRAKEIRKSKKERKKRKKRRLTKMPKSLEEPHPLKPVSSVASAAVASPAAVPNAAQTTLPLAVGQPDATHRTASSAASTKTKTKTRTKTKTKTKTKGGGRKNGKSHAKAHDGQKSSSSSTTAKSSGTLKSLMTTIISYRYPTFVVLVALAALTVLTVAVSIMFPRTVKRIVRFLFHLDDVLLVRRRRHRDPSDDVFSRGRGQRDALDPDRPPWYAI